jgi:broad specificity phosphatase PhoE
MRTLEHRRHARRDPGGVHLNAAGRAQASALRSTRSDFDRVVASPKPRAVESAEAMGYVVDATIVELGETPDDIGARIDALSPRSFADYLTLFERSPPVADYARESADRWRVELERVPDGGALLMISHGGLIELGTVAALRERTRDWGPVLSYLEGARLTWDGHRWVDGAVLRVPA